MLIVMHSVAICFVLIARANLGCASPCASDEPEDAKKLVG